MTLRSDAWYSNPAARHWRCPPASTAALAFHQSLPGYRPTNLVPAPALAAELRVGRVLVKDESGRLSLAAFKVLGVSWAVARLLTGSADGVTFTGLREAAAGLATELVTATDGNHGRALAYLGRLLGLPVAVFVPAVAGPAAAAAIGAEGAQVHVVDGSYDDAVTLAAGYAADAPGRELVQDTAWPGYEQVPGWIVAGYDTLLTEVDEQLGDLRADLVSTPIGVGSLAQAVVTHYRSGQAGTPAILGVEPDAAPCVLASLRAAEFGSVPTGTTVMAGLNCGTPSTLAWPVLAAGLDADIAVSDEAAVVAAADLAAAGIPAGGTGSAALAGVRAALTGPGAEERREELGVTSDSVLVLLCTDGRQGLP